MNQSYIFLNENQNNIKNDLSFSNFHQIGTPIMSALFEKFSQSIGQIDDAKKVLTLRTENTDTLLSRTSTRRETKFGFASIRISS
eukprot:snap_masked-scaffold_13-processed-gene-8.35-mRNA-1 protein AED:1.00 eAED:1.00 QI:0/-1/0/0/-1/1/1/0/84